MTAKIRSLVSKKKKRYKEDGFNLDLTYIYDNIIAMGFPADKLEGVYRNPIDEVVRFLDSKHYNHYRIYNLCSERHYDSNKFHNRVAEYPFDDHCPPSLELLRSFCEDVDNWLAQDKKNVAAIHCKAGKGRTGVMICAYMLHKGLVGDSMSALNYYGEKRTHDNRGVTIPSQKRYVDYYQELVKFNLNYRPIGIILCSIHLEPTPPNNFINTQFVIYHLDQHNRCTKINGPVEVETINTTASNPSITTTNASGCTINNMVDDISRISNNFQPSDLDSQQQLFHMNGIHHNSSSQYKASNNNNNNNFNNDHHPQQNWHHVTNSCINHHHHQQQQQQPLEYFFEDPLYVSGDIKIEFYQQKSKIIKKEKLFSFWFNTFFAVGSQDDNQRRYGMDMTSNDLNLVFYKEHLDKAYKDTTHKIFGEDFKVRIKFKRAPPPSVL